MTAKIIPFPLDGCPALPSVSRQDDGGAPINLIIELVGTNLTPLRGVSVRADDSLADLHAAIIRHLRWDGTHNYFFTHGSCRYEDPELFRAQDALTARCRKIYSAAEVPVGAVLGASSTPLFYVYNLACGREMRISASDEVPLKQFG